MNDIAEPHSSNRARLPSRSGRSGASAFWMIDGRPGFAFARYGNSSMTTGSGRSRPSPSSASTTWCQSREDERSRGAQMVGEHRPDPAQRFPVGGLIRGEVEPAGRLAERPEQERLALPAPA